MNRREFVLLAGAVMLTPRPGRAAQQGEHIRRQLGVPVRGPGRRPGPWGVAPQVRGQYPVAGPGQGGRGVPEVTLPAATLPQAPEGVRVRVLTTFAKGEQEPVRVAAHPKTATRRRRK